MNEKQGPLARRLPQKPDPQRQPEWRRRANLPLGHPERIGAKDMTSTVVS